MLQGKMGLTLRPGPRLRIEETYIYSGLRTYAGSGLSGVRRGTAVFDNHIIRSNAELPVQPAPLAALSSRTIARYCRTALSSRTDAAKRVGLDALFTYMLNPGTALHFGYTDLYDNLRLEASASPALQRTSFPDLNTGRQVFVKLSYLLRF